MQLEYLGLAWFRFVSFRVVEPLWLWLVARNHEKLLAKNERQVQGPL